MASCPMRRDVWFLLLVGLVVVSVAPFIVSRNSRTLWASTTAPRNAVKTLRHAQKPGIAGHKDPVNKKHGLPTKEGVAPEGDIRLPAQLVTGPDAQLYRPPMSLSTRHYNFSREVMPDAFLDHLQNMTRRIAKNWKSKGWTRYDKLNISDCSTSTPECTLFRDVVGPADGTEMHRRAYTKCCVEHRLLREVAVWTLDRLNAANVSYFLSTGTALGALRHGGVIIPWDTDVDVAIFPRDREKVEALFRNNGVHHFHKDPLNKPMFWVHHSRTGKPAQGPHVEIFYDAVYTKYPDRLLPLEPCTMYTHTVLCPNRRMFEVWFPSGWGVYGGGHYHGDHRCTEYRNGVRYEKEKC